MNTIFLYMCISTMYFHNHLFSFKKRTVFKALTVYYVKKYKQLINIKYVEINTSK